MATAKTTKYKKAAAKNTPPAAKRAYRRRNKEIGADIATPTQATEESEEASFFRALQHEREQHQQTRLKLDAMEGVVHQLQHQLDAVRHTVSRTVVLRNGQMAQNLEFSPIRTVPERLPLVRARD